MKYKVINYEIGNYDYDTIFIELGDKKEIYQIPTVKKLGIKKDDEIVIDDLYTPITEIKTDDTTATKTTSKLNENIAETIDK